MDPIEPAGPSPDHLTPSQPRPRRASAAANPSTQDRTSSGAPTTRPRASSVRSNHSNRSSIRLYRPPSFTNQPSSPALHSTSNLNLRNNGSRASFATLSGNPPEEPEGPSDAFEGARRRSSSEPRRGRWSAPSPAALPRLQPGQQPMRTVMEEPQSPNSARPTLELVRPAPVPEQPKDGNRKNVLRRTSEAALNRLSRNRAQTVGGPSPRPEIDAREYDSHLVDVLDVIGKRSLGCCTPMSLINVNCVPNLTILTVY